MPGGYPKLSQIRDPITQSVVKSLQDQIAALKTQVATLQAAALTAAATVDVKNQRVANVANPLADQDAVTRRYLREYVQAQLRGTL